MMHWATIAVLAANVLAPGREVPTREQVIDVPAELQAQLHDQIIARHHSKEQRLRLLIDWMSRDPQGLLLEYDNTRTRTLEETFRSRKANCL